MGMRRLELLGAMTALGLVLSSAPASGDEKQIPLSEVPKAVTDAFKAKFPQATIKNAIKEDDAGKITYEIESTIASGLSIDAVLKPNGDFVAIEKQLKIEELPAPVAAGMKAKYPTAKLTKAEEVTSDGKLTYELTVTKADGKSAVLVFDKDGKFIEEE
jgi:hypothetical protein